MTAPVDADDQQAASGFAQPGFLRRNRVVLVVVALVVVNAIVVVAAVLIIRRQATVPLGVAPGDVARDTKATIESIEKFWRQEMPATYGRPFVGLRGGFQSKTSGSPPFLCAQASQNYEDIKGNAFYCSGSADDYIAWDGEQLFPTMNQTFGSIGPAVALSHEMGHAIQARAGVRASSIVVELQADCFAGAWVAFAERSGDDRIELGPAALDGAIAAVLTLRDQPGTTAANPQAHGAGFDRVNAFQTGYDQGTRKCATFPTDGVTTTQLPFRTAADKASGGNLDYESAWLALSAALDPFWRVGIVGMAGLRSGATFTLPTRRPVESAPLPGCPNGAVGGQSGMYCSATNTVSWEHSVLRPIHDRIGDLATGALLADLWGRVGQVQAGLPVEGRTAGLQRDCMVGAWLASLSSGGVAGVQLSPGDIDEALSAIIASTFTEAGAREDRGDAFLRTRAFRAGLLDRSGACATARINAPAAPTSS